MQVDLEIENSELNEAIVDWLAKKRMTDCLPTPIVTLLLDGNDVTFSVTARATYYGVMPI